MNLTDVLKGNSYPGRGIVMGRSKHNTQAIIIYFIMGRSVNSRNRVFVTDGEGIRTEAHDPAKLTDPSLIIYSPVRRINGCTIVTNGDQTDTVYDFIQRGQGFEEALRTRTFEPDEPNFTPRISAILYPDGAYSMSILKSGDPQGQSVLRQFFEYPAPISGKGHLIHTYVGDGSPLPSFAGEPKAVELTGTEPTELAAAVWGALNEDNRVSLYAATIELQTGEIKCAIINRHDQEEVEG